MVKKIKRKPRPSELARKAAGLPRAKRPSEIAKQVGLTGKAAKEAAKVASKVTKELSPRRKALYKAHGVTEAEAVKAETAHKRKVTSQAKTTPVIGAIASDLAAKAVRVESKALADIKEVMQDVAVVAPDLAKEARAVGQKPGDAAVGITKVMGRSAQRQGKVASGIKLSRGTGRQVTITLTEFQQDAVAGLAMKNHVSFSEQVRQLVNGGLAK